MTGIEENMVDNIEKLTNEIIKNMKASNKKKVREYSTYFSEIVDSYCLDGVITFRKTMGTTR